MQDDSTNVEAAIAAAGSGDDLALREALDAGLDPDQAGASGWTPLIAACRGGHLSTVELLLERGASAHRTNPRGTTPFMYAKTAAFASGDTRVMERLLRAGADVNARDHQDLTVLDYVEMRAEALIRWLRDHGARRTAGE